jgi:hypothetical protein
MDPRYFGYFKVNLYHLSGSHLIIGMENEENYYLHLKWKKPKILSKMKGVVVESVAWNKDGSESTTR